MKIIYCLSIIFLVISCSKDPNQIYIDKVAEKVKKNDMGLDVGYRNVEFTWIDTTYVIAPDGTPADIVESYQASNTYRLMVGEVDQKVTATVTFDPDFNIIDIE